MRTRQAVGSTRALVRSVGLLTAIASVSAMSGCRSAGPYGHAAHYVELDEEHAATAGTREYDPVMALRQPETWREGKVGLFGIVESRAAGPGGQALVKLSVVRLEPRNLCERAGDEDSCRVTVSDKDFGVVWGLTTLHGDDDVGPRAVGQRSLLRIVGSIGQDVSEIDGAPVVHAVYCRHFPLLDYATRPRAESERSRPSARETR